MLVLFGAITHGAALAQDSGYVNNKRGISMTVPAPLDIQKKNDGDVLFVAKPGSDLLPSMTLVTQVGNPKITEKSIGELANDVVDSYRAVGLVDAESTGKHMMGQQSEGATPAAEAQGYKEKDIGQKLNLAGRTVFFTRVNYTRGDVPLTAGLYIFPAAESYFVLTLIDTTENLPNSIQMLHAAAKTVSITSKAPEGALITEQQSVVLWWFVGAIIFIAIIALIGWVLSKK